MSLHILSPSICPSSSPQHPRGLVCSVEDPVTGLPNLWLSLLAPQGEGPPMQTVSSFHIPFRVWGPNLTLLLPSYQYVIFLKASVVNKFHKFPVSFPRELFCMWTYFWCVCVGMWAPFSYSTILIWTLKIGSFKIFSLYYWKCFKIALFGWKVKRDS